MKNNLKHSILHVMSVNGPVIIVSFHKLNPPKLGAEVYINIHKKNWISLGTVDIIKTTLASVVIDDKDALYRQITPITTLRT